ncbi:MAG TPA: hypothetical protein VK964_01155 [Nocardioidaceae bacterium]|nr:hypothetical protein [Nocardioidaceae bacterium]
MLGSALALLAVTAAALLVPALVGLMAVERHRHLAEAEDTTRRLRLVLAAILVGLASLLLVAQVGGDPLTAAMVAVVLAGSVLVWAPLTRSWAVRGVVVWALLVSGAAGLMGWLAHSLAASSPTAAAWVLGGTLWLLLLLALARSQRYARAAIAGQAGLLPGASATATPLLRPAVSLAALLAASGVVVTVASGTGGPVQEGDPPQAGVPGSSTTSGVTVPLPSPSVATRTAGPGQPSAAMAGVVDVPWSLVSLVAGVAVAGPSPSGLVLTATCPPGDARVPAPAGTEAPNAAVAGTRPDGDTAPGTRSTPKATKPTSRPPRGPSSPAPGSGSGTSSSGSGPGDGPADGPGDGPADGPGDGPGSGPSVRPTPLLPASPVASPTAALTRLLGFQKDKPNRPAGAPAPGHGRPENARTPALPTPGRPSPLPPVLVVPPSGPVPPDQPVGKQSRTPGYEKEKANRPAQAPSPGHGRPSSAS